MMGEFEHLAGVRAADDEAEQLAFRAGFFAGHEDSTEVPVSGGGVPEGIDRREVGRAEPRDRVGRGRLAPGGVGAIP